MKNLARLLSYTAIMASVASPVLAQSTTLYDPSGDVYNLETKRNKLLINNQAQLSINLSKYPYNVVCDDQTDWTAQGNAAVADARKYGAAIDIGQQPNNHFCIFGTGGVDFVLNNVTFFSKTGTRLKTGVGAKRLALLTGYRPGFIGFQVDGTGNEASKTTLAADITAQITVGSLPSGATSTGSACAASSTFNMQPVIGNGTAAQVPVTTDATGKVTSVGAITVNGAYTDVPSNTYGRSTDDPVLRSIPMVGGTCAGVVLDLTMGTTNQITVADTTDGPGILIGQRINIRTTLGNIVASWVKSINGNVLGISPVFIPPAITGGRVYASFGAVDVQDSQYYLVKDNTFNASYGSINVDDGLAAGFYKGNQGGRVTGNRSTGSRMFEYIDGRNTRNSMADFNQFYGGWNSTGTDSGDGVTKKFKLPAAIFLTRELGQVTVNGVPQTNPTHYTLTDQGSTITFVTAPPAGTNNISYNGTYYGADGVVIDCTDTVSSCGGKHVVQTTALNYHRPFYSKKGNNWTLDGPGLDSCGNSCITSDGSTGGNYGYGVNVNWGPVQISTFNNSQFSLYGNTGIMPSSYPVSGQAGVITKNGMDTNSSFELMTLHGAKYGTYNGGVCLGPGCTTGEPFQSDLIVSGPGGTMTMRDGSLTLALAGTLGWALGTKMGSSVTNGTVLLQSSSGGQGALQLGGATNAFPMLQKRGAMLASRLADDSGFTGFQSSYLTVSGAPVASGAGSVNLGYQTGTIANCGSLAGIASCWAIYFNNTIHYIPIY